MSGWYFKIYDKLGEEYLKFGFVKHTKAEVDFIKKVTRIKKKAKILDLGCGFGRHSIEFAKRGYQVVGVDFSRKLLSIAKKKAKKEKVKVKFILKDAREIPFKQEFDLVISLYDSAFGVLENDQENFKVLQKIHRALKSKGKFVLNIVNGANHIKALPKTFSYKEKDRTYFGKGEFDVLTNRYYTKETMLLKNGKRIDFKTQARLYTLPEVIWLLQQAGFKVLGSYGNFENKKLNIKDYQMTILGEKI